MPWLTGYDIDPETEVGWFIKSSRSTGFQALGLKHFSIEMLWIFDNEIDWVIQGRAHFGRLYMSQDRTQRLGKCSKKKSVFKENGRSDVSRKRSISRRIIKVNFEQDRSDSAPCAGVNSMVKLLRAHGGCLGRDRRRRTWQAAISFGKPHTGVTSEDLRMGKPS
jgi:hypothetical protein